MSKKFIPNGDLDFVTKAECFARTIAKDPARYEVSPEDSIALTQAVMRFRVALTAARSSAGRSAVATRAKEDARREAELIVRRLGHQLRSNPRIDAVGRIELGLRERSAKAKQLSCPKEAPRLRFLRALHEGNGATPVHELDFREFHTWSSVKPAGAVRLELFVDLVPPDEPIPAHPAANHGSRPWYLRSYTRSPIKLIPPMPRVPMRIVYWGRWADSVGNVGPFSATAVAWIEGGSHHALPGGAGMALPGSRKPVPVLEHLGSDPGPAGRERTFVVAVLEAQYQSFGPRDVAPSALPAPADGELRRLEGPAPTSAAA